MIQYVYKVRETKPRSRKKDLKKSKKVLDKLHKVWYNKNTKRTGTSGNRKKWVVTDTKSQEDRKETIMTTNEMTMRKYHEAVAAIPNAPADVVAKAKAELAKMDAANANRKSKPSKTSVANEPIKAAIVELLTTNGAMVASAIGAALTNGEVEVSTSKASALCGQLVKAEVLAVEDVKVKGKGTVKQYSIATPSAE